jgi:hypothetical protein
VPTGLHSKDFVIVGVEKIGNRLCARIQGKAAKLKWTKRLLFMNMCGLGC